MTVPPKRSKRLVHRVVGQVGDVEDHADLFHRTEQRGAEFVERAGRAGAVAVAGIAVVREADDPQAGGPPFGDVVRRRGSGRRLPC